MNIIANKKLSTSSSFFSRLPLRFKSDKTCWLQVYFLKPHSLQLSWLEILSQPRHDGAEQEFASLTKTKSKTEPTILFRPGFNKLKTLQNFLQKVAKRALSSRESFPSEADVVIIGGGRWAENIWDLGEKIFC